LKYLHLDEGLFCRVRRFAWCNDPESYAGGSVSASRVTLAGQVKGEQPDKERYTGPPGWGLSVYVLLVVHVGLFNQQMKNFCEKQKKRRQW